MLVLSRKLGEVIRLGDDILVKVVRIESGKVRLGITTPSGVSILREEIRGEPGRYGEAGPRGKEE